MTAENGESGKSELGSGAPVSDSETTGGPTGDAVDVPGTDDEDAVPPPRTPSEEELVYLIDLAFATARVWWRVPDRFHSLARRMGIDTNSTPVKPLRRALGYFLTEETRSDGSSVQLRWKTGFGSEALPPPRNRVAHNDEAAVWERLADQVTYPAVRARFHDLLILRGGSETPDRAATAISAYVDHVEAPGSTIKTRDGTDVKATWDEPGLVLSLGRALSLMHIAASSAGGPDVITRAVRVALARSTDLLRSTRPGVGPVVSILAFLTANRKRLSQDDLARLVSLIEESASRYADADHAVDRLTDLLIVLDPGKRDAALRLRIQTRLDLADGREPMAAMHYLEEAARIARRFHLTDLADEAIRRMQRLAKLDHGYQAVSTDVVAPTEIFDAEVRRASDGADWRESMSNWLMTLAPSGDLEANRRTSSHIASQSVVERLASVVVVGADNMPRWRPTTEDDRDAYGLARTEALSMKLSGWLLSEALDRIAAQHGVPSEGELSNFLSGNGNGDTVLAAALARSFRRYWAGDLDGALHTAAVHVESAPRALVMLLDEPAYTVARTNTPGKYVGLDQLLELLARRDFDENWDRFVRTLLLGPTGQNLRHDVAHGFLVEEPDRSTVALALRACSLFVNLLWQPSAVSAPVSGQVLPQPAWTVTDAALTVVRASIRSPRLIPRLLRAEVTAVGSVVKKTWRRLPIGTEKETRRHQDV